jgi:hypothetical protein
MKWAWYRTQPDTDYGTCEGFDDNGCPGRAVWELVQHEGKPTQWRFYYCESCAKREKDENSKERGRVAEV